jgi:predicted secreted protein
LTTVQLVILFAVSWWIVLFMVLPWGVRPDETPVAGTVESAPARPRLALKFAITTFLAVLLTAGADRLVRADLVRLRPPPTTGAG